MILVTGTHTINPTQYLLNFVQFITTKLIYLLRYIIKMKKIVKIGLKLSINCFQQTLETAYT